MTELATQPRGVRPLELLREWPAPARHRLGQTPERTGRAVDPPSEPRSSTGPVGPINGSSATAPGGSPSVGPSDRMRTASGTPGSGPHEQYEKGIRPMSDAAPGDRWACRRNRPPAARVAPQDRSPDGAGSETDRSAGEGPGPDGLSAAETGATSGAIGRIGRRRSEPAPARAVAGGRGRSRAGGAAGAAGAGSGEATLRGRRTVRCGDAAGSAVRGRDRPGGVASDTTAGARRSATPGPAAGRCRPAPGHARRSATAPARPGRPTHAAPGRSRWRQPIAGRVRATERRARASRSGGSGPGDHRRHGHPGPTRRDAGRRPSRWPRAARQGRSAAT